MIERSLTVDGATWTVSIAGRVTQRLSMRTILVTELWSSCACGIFLLHPSAYLLLVGILPRDEASGTSLRRAIIYGSVLASFTVEKFSLDRLREITIDDVNARFEAFQQLMAF